MRRYTSIYCRARARAESPSRFMSDFSASYQYVTVLPAMRRQRRPLSHKLITRVVPLLFAINLFVFSYGRIVGVSSTVNMISYGSIVSIWLVAAMAFIKWIRKVDKPTQRVVLALMAFLVLYPIGLYLAEDIPEFNMVRGVLVNIFTAAAFIIVLLLASPKLHRVRKATLALLVLAALVNAVTTGYNYTEEVQFGIYERQGGLFDQPNIAGALLSAGLLILLFVRNTKLIWRILSFVLALVMTVATLLTESYLAIMLGGIFWVTMVLDSQAMQRRYKILVVIFMILLTITGALLAESRPQAGGSSMFLNRKVDALRTMVAEKDFFYMLEHSSIIPRWAATVQGINEISNSVLFGKGLFQREVYIEYWRGGRLNRHYLVPHNSVVVVWLQTGLFGTLPYVFFIGYTALYIWDRFSRGRRKLWGAMIVSALILTVVSITGSLEPILFYLYVAMLCIAPPPQDKS